MNSLVRGFKYAIYSRTTSFVNNATFLPNCNPAITIAAKAISEKAKGVGSSKFVLEGDSIATGAQLVSRRFQDFAIPGSTTIDVAYRLPSTALRCMPEKFVINAGGNDVAMGQLTTDQSIAALMWSFHKIKDTVPKDVLKRMAWVKVTPVLSSKPELQGKIIAFNEKVSAVMRLNNIDVLDPWPILCGADGFIKPGLVAADELHWNVAAYMLVVPLLNAWFDS